MAVAAAMASGALTLGGAARAAASSGPETLGQQCASVASSACDTDFTPVPQDGTQHGWYMADGALFGKNGKIVPHSQVPYTVDFFTVRFNPSDENDGFAAGAECVDSSTPFDELDTCQRVPTIWHYYVSLDGPQWTEVYKGSLCTLGSTSNCGPGYVGALAYMADGKVLAVGGGGDGTESGIYPRRESPAPIDSPGYKDPAGRARAWLNGDAGWEEISDQFQAPSVVLDGGETPGGLTALDCNSDPAYKSQRLGGALWFGGENCAAGGLHQLWTWHGGRFVESYDDKSAASDFDFAPDFRFRVRQMRWASPALEATSTQFYAVTAGCCATPVGTDSQSVPTSLGVVSTQNPDDPTIGPRLLTFGNDRWSATAFSAAEPAMSGNLSSAALADSYYSLVVSPRDGLENSLGEEQAERMGGGLSVIATPGGAPNAASETTGLGAPASRIVFDRLRLNNSQLNDSATNADALVDLHLTGVRLVSADGDFEDPLPGYSGLTGDVRSWLLGPHAGAAGLPDWAVGSLSATCQSAAMNDCQAAAYSPKRQGDLTPNPLTCTVLTASGGCEVSKDGVADYAVRATTGAHSQGLFYLPSYALNSFTEIADGLGWAVGDKGAILRLGGSGTIGSADEPSPPAFGTARPASLQDNGAYDPYRPLAANETGAVPSFAGQPLERFATLQPVAAGSPDTPSLPNGSAVSAITMSRDGSEGWAIGPNDSGTLLHYTGGRWLACEPVGSGQVPPDSACTSLADMFTQQVPIKTIARVPREHEPDPSEADAFEVVAIAGSYRPRGSSTTYNSTVLVYRQGGWSIDEPSSRALNTLGAVQQIDNIAFTAPDDGWVVGYDQFKAKLLHFDLSTRRWADCNPAAEAPLTAYAASVCGGEEGALPHATDINPVMPMRLAVAGRRLYLAGGRVIENGTAGNSGALRFPLILHKDPGEPWTSKDGGYDPGCQTHDDKGRCAGSSDGTDQGALSAMSMTELPHGRFAGWAVGVLGASLTEASSLAGGSLRLLRLEPGSNGWEPWTKSDATGDYFPGTSSVTALLSTSGPDGQERDFIIPPTSLVGATPQGSYPMLQYDVLHRRWEALAAPFSSVTKAIRPSFSQEAAAEAVAPDGTGGFWLAARPSAPPTYGPAMGVQFYHYTDRVSRPVFSDIAHPIREPITATAVGGDGSFWVATGSPTVYRYDRVTGWDRITIPNWDPGRIVTNPTPAYALALGPDGSGVVVGKAGRIANIDADRGVLDQAAGVLCSRTTPANASPCGTGYDLHAATIAPDGSAMVAGNHLSLLWRSAGGQFCSIARPMAAPSTNITGASMPQPGHAWLTTDTGRIFAGRLSGHGCAGWRWQPKPEADVDTLTAGFDGRPLALDAIAIDVSGRGVAVGEEGLILERSSDGSWRRLSPSLAGLDYLHSIALPPSGYGDGTLIGGGVGLVLTRVDGRFVVARHVDFFDGLTNANGSLGAARTVGVAVTGGEHPGEVEAWAVLQGPEFGTSRPSPFPQALLHYSSRSSGALLDGGTGRAKPLPDTPGPREGEISFAAFGKQECQLSDEPTCPEPQGSNLLNDLIARRTVDAIVSAHDGSDGPALAVFTGDVGNAAGRDYGVEHSGAAGQGSNTALDPDVVHHRWTELIAQPLQDAGVPVFAALGAQDLSQTNACLVELTVTGTPCAGTRQQPAGNTGDSLQWRQSMAIMPAPWGAPGNAPAPPSRGLYFSGSATSNSGVEGPSVSTCPPRADGGGLRISIQGSRPVPLCSTPTVGTQDAPGQVAQAISSASPGSSVPSEQLSTQSVPDQSVSTGGAHTHYALDICRGDCPSGARRVARLIVVDTSLRRLSGVAALQNPVEDQLTWLRLALCKPGQEIHPKESCTRALNEPAIVVSETPSYSYGPGGATDTLSDSAVFEALLFKYHANVVVSGRLGWNGLYYATAPGIHEPCPGAGYPTAVPDPNTRVPCSAAAGGGPPAPDPSRVAKGLGSALQGLSAPAAPRVDPTGVVQDAGGTGVIPFVVAASAGGKFGPADQPSSGAASEGYWRGYTIVRLAADGDPAKTIVEQRPVFDWIGLKGTGHMLRPGQRATLRGFGREPIGMDQSIRYDDIDSPTITHRYDLLEADPEKPWVPKVVVGNGNPHGYVPLDPTVGTIDPQTGNVLAQNSNHGRVFAIAVLSVGDKAATWPLVFEAKRSYVARGLRLAAPAAAIGTRVRSFSTSSFDTPTSPPPTGPPPSVAPPLRLPPPLALPPLGIPTSTPSTPPVPPAPPAPPAGHQAAPLSLAINPAGLTVPPTTGVTAQPTPPVNPSPPGGARKEARQRQAASAKSEEGGAPEGGTDPGEAQGRISSADQPRSAMTRRDRVKPAADGFTPLARPHAQASAWTIGLQWGGGIGLMALALALGYTTLRPTPRRRRPEVPQPAWAPVGRRGG